MKVSVGTDHAGVELRAKLVDYLQQQGHEVIDHGAYNDKSVDYPDYAQLVCKDDYLF